MNELLSTTHEERRVPGSIVGENIAGKWRQGWGAMRPGF